MILRHLVPSAPLSDFVALLWHAEADVDLASGPPPRERVLPDGSLQVIVGLADEPADLRAGVVVGARRAPQEIEPARLRALVGVQFRPGGAAPFLGLPADALEGVVAPMDEVWGRAAPALRARLLEARGARARFALLERFLLARAAGRLERHPTVRYALTELGAARERPPTIAELVERTGFSQRHFTALFRREVGLTPKAYARVARLQRALAELRRGPPSLSQVALRCGYADQAHFANEFKLLAGVTPSAYLATPGAYGNHVPLAS